MIAIFKGDDTGGIFGRRVLITISADEGVSLDGCSGEFILNGIVKPVPAPLVPGEVREIVFTHEETEAMKLGIALASFVVIDADGLRSTVGNTYPVRVTNCVEELQGSGASILLKALTINDIAGLLNALNEKQQKLTAGLNITIAQDGTISASVVVDSVNGQTGAVALTGADIPLKKEEAAQTIKDFAETINNEFVSHTVDTDNPHGVTAEQVGALPTTGGWLFDKEGNTDIFIGGRDAEGNTSSGMIMLFGHEGEQTLLTSNSLHIEDPTSPSEGDRHGIYYNGNKVATEEQVETAKTELNSRIDLIEATNRPNMNIVGSPTFREGVVSGFSANDYLMFPTQVDVGQNSVDFYMGFTTGANVSTQQNILDSWCGLALAIQNGNLILAVSSNGTSFETDTSLNELSANSSYHLKLSFDYNLSNPSEYTVRAYIDDDMSPWCEVAMTAPLNPTATYWGGANPKSGVHHIFGGTINLNECRMEWNGNVVWRGYDELPTVKFDPTATPRLDTAEKIVAQTKPLAQYPIKAVVGNALLDRTVNTSTGGAFTFPEGGDGARDFVVVVAASATAPSVSFPSSGVSYFSDDDAVWTAEADKINVWYFTEITANQFMVAHKALAQSTQA